MEQRAVIKYMNIGNCKVIVYMYIGNCEVKHICEVIYRYNFTVTVFSPNRYYFRNLDNILFVLLNVHWNKYSLTECFNIKRLNFKNTRPALAHSKLF